MHLIGALLALASAAVWGGGDFAGGLAARRSDSYRVLAQSALSGALMLVGLSVAFAEPWPSAHDSAWASLAGVSGALGIASLYRGLAVGRAASVAPLAAVVSAAVPVVFNLFIDRPPAASQQIGFAAAIAGLWLATRSQAGCGAAPQNGILYGVLAGLGFGGFFVLIAQVGPGAVFTPLVVARGAAVIVGLVTVLARRSRLPAAAENPWALLAGVLDAGGNALYLLATRFTRLDAAAVLSSLYPATTVILSRAILKERISLAQWWGVGLCLAAVALIAV